MGDQQVRLPRDKSDVQQFIMRLLEDVRSMEYMMDNDWFESDKRCIGAEQEMVLIDRRTFKPAMVAEAMLEDMAAHPWLESELAKFNLEITLSPQEFMQGCLTKLEEETTERLRIIESHLANADATALLTGILPTLRKSHMTLDNLTPKERYHGLMSAINAQLKGNKYELYIEGIDELKVTHDSPFLEACNTSFQVHLQVTPDEFVQMYNIAQALAGPVMAIAANSPLVFGKRLWHETRIAMFQQSIDTRLAHGHMRESSPRVTFGNDWLHDSILDIYRDDITRFRVLMSADVQNESMVEVMDGKVPKLKALQVHNSTVYRWNRPCYGISPNGKPHLRIENRVLPAGPTVRDEVANAAFWLGLMMGFKKAYPDIREHLSFEDVRDNFIKAARTGIDSTFNWMGDTKKGACDLALDLLPIAEEGLRSQKVSESDIKKYLSIIQKRAEKHTNGARWMLRSYTSLRKVADQDEALSIVTSTALKNQRAFLPIHEWEIPTLSDLEDYRPIHLTAEECMTTDLLTVRPDDILALVGEMMTWKRSRYVLVEDDNAHLVGLVTHQQIVKHLLNTQKAADKEALHVSDIMVQDPLSIYPETSIREAMSLMKDNYTNCLPVVNKEKELVGVITESDFLRIAQRLLGRLAEVQS
ncbi:MAG: CBS domain-containing protein [Saprospiraceae bacterium]|nr:CBS domain-containing protein [Saprospiraceae bacterium]